MGDLHIGLYLVSLLFFLSGIAFFFFMSKGGRIRHRLLWLTMFLVLAIIPMNLAQNDDKPMTRFGFLPKTMQAFSMDVDYDAIFDVDAPQGEGASNPSGASPKVGIWALLLLAYKAVLYSAAPIVGGAVIYDVLAGFSPNLRLLFARRRQLYVFSGLNECSLGLAQSIASDRRRGKRPVIVFAGCDAGACEADEAKLMARAKELQAICLPNDLPDCRLLERAGQCVFFLMDRDGGEGFGDSANLSTLCAMLEAQSPVWSLKRGCHFFCFTDRAGTVEGIRTAKLAFDERYAGEAVGHVRIHVVRDYAHTACTLMQRYPLFEGLSEKAPGEPLRVLIVGNNDLSREVFKTVFWCGQLLDHPLQIAVANGQEGDFGPGTAAESRLAIQCPELFESCVEGSECLRQTLEDDFGAPYAALSFIEARPDRFFEEEFLTTPRAVQYGSAEPFALAECDYMILMTGSDLDNIELADHLWRRLIRLKLSGTDIGRKTVAVAVEDEALAGISQTRYDRLRELGEGLSFVCFGSVKDRFRWENVFGLDPYHQADAPATSPDDAIHGIPGMDATQDDIYNEWSNEARWIHQRYKMFSTLHRELAAAEDRAGVLKDKIDYCRRIREDPKVMDRLSWLEHRRWNAFLRTKGFRQPPLLVEKLREMAAGRCEGGDWRALSLYAYKNVPAQLHPNLVESAGGARGEAPDLLDLASDMRSLVDRLRDGKSDAGDIKRYDLPNGENGPTLDRGEVCALLAGTGADAAGQALEAAWARVKAMCPEIESREDPRHPGRWFADDILDMASRR